MSDTPPPPLPTRGQSGEAVKGSGKGSAKGNIGESSMKAAKGGAKKKKEEKPEESDEEGHLSEIDESEDESEEEDDDRSPGSNSTLSGSAASTAAGAEGRGRRLSISDSLEDYRKILLDDDPQQGAKKRKVKGLRALVSKKKKRYKDRKFDLDLAYITDRIIAMGFPAEKSEALYRNPMKTVQKFLTTRHGGHYKVYNLCSERSYDSDRFELVAAYPFDDHHCPSLEIMDACVKDTNEFLDQHPENVAVIHCKAGKGRTGVMICALLYYRYRMKGVTVQDSLGFYGDRRTFDKKGVTINSQRRFILYYADVIAHPEKVLDVPLKLTRVTVFNAPKIENSFFVIYNEPGCSRYSSLTNSKGVQDKAGNIVFTLPEIDLKREVRFDFHHKEEKKLFYCWFHTAWVENASLTITIDELDGKVSKKKNIKKFSSDFKVQFDFASTPDAKPATSAAAKKGSGKKKAKAKK